MLWWKNDRRWRVRIILFGFEVGVFGGSCVGVLGVVLQGSWVLSYRDLGCCLTGILGGILQGSWVGLVWDLVLGVLQGLVQRFVFVVVLFVQETVDLPNNGLYFIRWFIYSL